MNDGLPAAERFGRPAVAAFDTFRPMTSFNALVVREAEAGNPKTATAKVEQLGDADLPDYGGDEAVVVDIDYSSLNYKDGMALTGKGHATDESLRV